MDKIGVYQFSIDAYLADFRGRATLPMIGGFMLQAATKHAEERGFGYSVMMEKKRAWVLSRMTIEMMEYPKNETSFYIKTWIRSANKLFTERCFSFSDEAGNAFGYARSIWASIDLKTRRPANVLELGRLGDLLDTQESCPIDNMKKIIPIKEKIIDSKFVVKYSDVDINKHLSSMKYIQHFVDLFDIEIFKTKEIHRFEINYLNEIYYGSTIELVKTKESDNIFVLEMLKDNTSVCSARLTWGQGI